METFIFITLNIFMTSLVVKILMISIYAGFLCTLCICQFPHFLKQTLHFTKEKKISDFK